MAENPSSSEVVHIASQPVQVDSYLRQRCVWCGAELIDQDLTGLRLVVGDDSSYKTWPPGGLIGTNGPATYVIEHADGDPIPRTFCGAPDDLSGLDHHKTGDHYGA